MNDGMLEQIGAVDVPGADEFFVYRNFKENISIPNGVLVRISWAGRQFIELCGGRVEVKVPPARVRVWRLLKNAKNSDMVAALGLGPESEVQFAYMWQLLLRQPLGGEGAFDLDKDNIFFVRLDPLTVEAFTLFRFKDAWRIDNLPMISGPIWRPGQRVFST